jgi:hypothetical protein
MKDFPMSLQMGNKFVLPFFINETDLLAGTVQDIAAPVDGFVEEITTVVQKAVTTGGVIKASVGATDVVGASITVADAAAKGTVQTALSTKPNASRTVAKGDAIKITPSAAFATAGAVNGHVIINTGS